MKKRIAILVVFLLILCLTLVGCGQGGTDDKTYNIGSTDSAEQSEQGGQSEQDGSDDAEDLPGYNFDTGDATIMDETNNGTTDDANDSSSDTFVSGIKNADGTYTHNVDGYELVLKTNLADYVRDGVFYYAELAEDLGWFIKENLRAKYEDDPNWPAYYWGDSNEYMVTFNDPTSMSYMQLYYECPYNNGLNIIFKRYDKDDSNSITYQINPGGSYDANYEQIVILTFQFENIPLSPDSDPLEYINQTQTGTWVVYK